jgi:hypothetical protein
VKLLPGTQSIRRHIDAKPRYSARDVAELLWRVAEADRPRGLAGKFLEAIYHIERRANPSKRAAGIFTFRRGLRLRLRAPATGPLREWDYIQCPLGATLAAAHCADRQEARIASGRARYANPESGGWAYPECRRCAVGAGYRERMRGYVPAPFRSYDAASCARQRAAQRRQALTEVAVPSLDEPPTAGKG